MNDLAIIDPLCSALLSEDYGLARVFQLRLLSRDFNARVSEFLRIHVGEIVGKILTIYKQDVCPEIAHEQRCWTDSPKARPQRGDLFSEPELPQLDYCHIAEETIRNATFPSPSNLAEALYRAGLPIKHLIRTIYRAFYLQTCTINVGEFTCPTLIKSRQQCANVGEKLFKQLITQNRFNIDLSVDDEKLDDEIAIIRCYCLESGLIPESIQRDLQRFLPIFTRIHRAELRQLRKMLIKNQREIACSPATIHLIAWTFMYEAFADTYNENTINALCVFCDYNPNIFELFAKQMVWQHYKKRGLLRFLSDVEKRIYENPQKMLPSPMDKPITWNST
ncbi:MAG: hypothetical protein M0R33_18940 [Methylomonas sp.]|jgi:hypothetical protein|uniref:hypothetical protein n=1 Tax=Methylomonas sp. TaxID=418 RepID=UPI0025CC6384|nr:hypothetical protein [Methylomonas sp.]MCK9608522.1 hypothetical protein [Methylomonas sp.]